MGTLFIQVGTAREYPATICLEAHRERRDLNADCPILTESAHVRLVHAGAASDDLQRSDAVCFESETKSYQTDTRALLTRLESPSGVYCPVVIV